MCISKRRMTPRCGRKRKGDAKDPNTHDMLAPDRRGIWDMQTKYANYWHKIPLAQQGHSGGQPSCVEHIEDIIERFKQLRIEISPAPAGKPAEPVVDADYGNDRTTQRPRTGDDIKDEKENQNSLRNRCCNSTDQSSQDIKCIRKFPGILKIQTRRTPGQWCVVTRS